MKQSTTTPVQEIWDWLKEVTDPEIPVLNVVEMGIIRGIDLDDQKVIITITPTYSGCPAMNTIETDIKEKLQEKGIFAIDVITDFKESWTTDWMTDNARKKLKNYGIAPPSKRSPKTDFLTSLKQSKKTVACPYCNSLKTELQSHFGSTACKSLHYCNGCHQPFEHFKCI